VLGVRPPNAMLPNEGSDVLGILRVPNAKLQLFPNWHGYQVCPEYPIGLRCVHHPGLMLYCFPWLEKLHSYLFLQKATNFLTVECGKQILPGRRVISSTSVRRLKRGLLVWHLAEKLGVQPNFPTLTYTHTSD